MSVKSKKLRKAARTAAMSALIVSAIVGTSVVASAADNNTIVSSGQVLTVVESSTVKTAASLTVSGGTVYVGATSDNGFNITGDAKKGTVVTNGGKIFVGQSDATTSAPNAIMTTDNLSITGGEVSVANGGTLISKDLIDINAGGTLKMMGTAGTVASGSTVKAINVNVNAGGTLAATQGTANLINVSGAVNLKGGTINVDKAASLTIADASGSAAGVAGTLVVTNGGKFNSYGGIINADVVVTNTTTAGAAAFSGGTTTVDNLTVSAGGTATIEGNATVNSKGNVAIDGSGSKLEMKGGTLRVLDPAGAVNVKNSGVLLASAGVNTVDAKVNVTASGEVKVTGAASLTITKDLTVDGGTVSVIGSAKNTANLILGGKLTAGAGDIQVGSSSEGTAKGILTLGYGALTASTVATGAITLGDGTTGSVNSGTLIVKDYGKASMEVGSGTATDKNLVLDKTVGGKLTDDYETNNVVIWGKQLTNNGQTIEATTDGSKNITAGVDVKITGTGEISAVITAPSISAPNNSVALETGGVLNLIGVGMGDASNKTTDLTTLTLNSGAVSVNDGATLHATTLDMTAGTVDVINATASFDTLKATGGTIFVDPAIVTIGSIEDNDLKAVSLLTGAGSLVTLGGAQGWMAKPMADAGFAFNDTTKATLGIAVTDTITIGTGVVAVDPSIVKDGADYKNGVGGSKVEQGNNGAFWAGNNSLTVIDASGLEKDEAVFEVGGMSGSKIVNIVDGAKLHVANLTVNGLQIFTANGGGLTVNNGAGTAYDPTGSNAGWAGNNNLIQPDRMLTNVRMNNTGKLTADAALASNALGMSHEFNDLMGGVWGNALNNTNSGSAGIRFVSRAASTDYGLSADKAAKTIEGAAQMGAVAGVQGVTMGAANAATSAVATRTSFAQPLMDKTKAVAMHVDTDGSVSLDSGLNAGNGMKNGFALWIMPLYQSNNVWGMDAGNFKSGYNSDLGGVALGADYTINDMFRFGAALNIGAGYSESSGDFNSTDNSFNFWGINLYGGWTMNNFGVTADVGYTGNYNKVEQEVPMSLQVPNLKSDINSSAWTAGVKAEYKFETSVMDIIPHVGVRYMGLTTDEYSVKGGGTLFKVDQDHQSIWTFPIGVTLSKTMDTGSGWAFKPQLDLAVIPAAGDVEARSKSRIPGAPGSAEAKMQVVDYVTFDGGVGFDFSNENLSFGLNYNIQASEHRTGHGVFGTVRYEF